MECTPADQDEGRVPPITAGQQPTGQGQQTAPHCGMTMMHTHTLRIAQTSLISMLRCYCVTPFTCVATALASSVLPLPGGPYSSTPERRRKPVANRCLQKANGSCGSLCHTCTCTCPDGHHSSRPCWRSGSPHSRLCTAQQPLDAAQQRGCSWLCWHTMLLEPCHLALRLLQCRQSGRGYDQCR